MHLDGTHHGHPVVAVYKLGTNPAHLIIRHILTVCVLEDPIHLMMWARSVCTAKTGHNKMAPRALRFLLALLELSDRLTVYSQSDRRKEADPAACACLLYTSDAADE